MSLGVVASDGTIVRARNVYDNIADEMKPYPQWGGWRAEWLNGPDAKPKKVPYNVRSHTRASVNNPNDWCDFETAVLAVIAPGSRYSGLGFVFTSDDPFSGIDLDHSNDPAIIARHAVIRSHFDSYTELSPSGLGIHIIVRGKLNGIEGVRRDNVEIYSRGRFFTMTGDVVAR